MTHSSILRTPTEKIISVVKIIRYTTPCRFGTKTFSSEGHHIDIGNLIPKHARLTGIGSSPTMSLPPIDSLRGQRAEGEKVSSLWRPGIVIRGTCDLGLSPQLNPHNLIDLTYVRSD